MTRAATQRLPDAPPGLPLPSVRAPHTAAKFASAHAGKTVDVLLRAKRDVAAAKVFFRRAFRSQGRLPHKITLDGYQASHRAASEVLGEHPEGNRCEIRSSKYLKRFRRAATTIAGIELMHRIRKGQFKLGKLRVKNKTAHEIWNAVLGA